MSTAAQSPKWNRAHLLILVSWVRSLFSNEKQNLGNKNIWG